MTPVRIGIAGLGTVGAATLRLLRTHAEPLALRCGRPLAVTAVSARDRARARGVDLDGLAWLDDPADLAEHPEVDLVVEVIGGADGPARALVERALAAGRPVVTANKALLAHHGMTLAACAEAAGVALGWEAAVAGGIPAIKGLSEGLAANRLGEVHGILNGTCNYILTQMRETGRPFAEVLAEAQALGYAEADPGFDIDGIDTAHKLALLTAVAFGTAIDLASVQVEGIRHVSADDIAFADQLGYRIKLLAIARLTAEGVEQRVHPAMVPVRAPIAAVDGVLNAVVAAGDFVDQVLFVGRGAGAGPTASAVVADIIDIARGRRHPVFGLPVARMAPHRAAPLAHRRGAYYLRLMVRDRPGVIADVAAALRDQAVSLESMLQRGRSADEAVPVVFVTHETTEEAMQAALARIAALPVVVEPPRLIRIEQF